MSKDLCEQELERWKELERAAATRAAVFHGQIRDLAAALGVSAVENETRLAAMILEAIAERHISPGPEIAQEGGHLPSGAILGHSGGLGVVAGAQSGLESARAVLELPFGAVVTELGTFLDTGWLVGMSPRGLAYLPTGGRLSDIRFAPNGTTFEAQEAK